MDSVPGRWRRRPLVAAAALALVAACATVQLTSNSQPASAAVAPAALGPLVWSDDFNGAAGSAPDGSKWGHDTGGSGWGNNELEYYTTSTSNASLDGNGHLVITARKENPSGYGCWYGSCTYTSARLNTSGKFSQQYGHIEASIKMPRGQGIWPAFWALGDNIGSVGWPNSGEIDIMETIGSQTGTNHGSLHGPGYSGGNPLTGTYTLPNGQSLADGFHAYAVDWSPNTVSFSVDGNVYETHTSAETNGNPWAFNHPFFLLLNVAVGGNWPGSPNSSTSFPQQMVVDYIHVYGQSGSGGGSAGRITGLGGKCVDVAGASTTNGTKVQLYDCNGTAAQQWTVGSDGTVRALGKCMDVAAAGTANGAKVQLYDCNGTNAQKWTRSGSQFINTGSGKCLDATDQSSANGNQLQIWTCTGAANQQWSVS
ncbi:glycoside hydrolase family 16 protein [Rugosimonospora africana]|uniref:Endo-1,3-beta-glucanase n=1 Tax=Rugosimonospora africana TaxID=556532 RepID=A0A8J3QRF9_9ACTN|nr:glycoside hydrolase family 16 protein [Rugosimonospora africana]GIH15244.1 endo-1,3-beta-glucanase [Rugosimonospora africana]